MQAHDNRSRDEIQLVHRPVQAPTEPEESFPLFVMHFRRRMGPNRSFNQHWGLFLEKFRRQQGSVMEYRGDAFHANPGNDGTTKLEHRKDYNPAESEYFIASYAVPDVEITVEQYETCCRAAAQNREFGILGNNCHRYVMDVLNIMVSEGIVTKESYTKFFSDHGTVFTGPFGRWINKGFLLTRPTPEQRDYLYEHNSSSYRSAYAQQAYLESTGGSQRSYDHDDAQSRGQGESQRSYDHGDQSRGRG
ncbi:hypothetical protein AA313_de0201429 [Arthrobotrys entomopaga]|nr:hypothetical protein AA313_de0201429 [Arthrobotrys entomopaga]